MLWRIVCIYLPIAAARIKPPPVVGNEVYGEPQITCDAQHIIFFVNTSGPFGGNAYTKGYFAMPGCHYRGNSTENLVELAIPTSDMCGVTRSRMKGKKGLELEVTVILMFHHIFLTKGDRSFNLKCVYAEIETQVTRNIDVSTLPPQDLPAIDVQNDEQQAPNCLYEVLSGGPQGEPVRFATIGEDVYHRWSCETGRNPEFCMMVHTCTADDGQGWLQELIDRDGCTLDSFLIQNLQSDGELSMGQRSQVFKFADRPTVYFNCMIKLQPRSTDDPCPMPNEFCDRRSTDESGSSDSINDEPMTTTEAFPTPKIFVPERKRRVFRKAREILNGTTMEQIDLGVAAPAISVFDVPVEDKSSSSSNLREGEVCLSRYVFAITFALFLCSLLLFSIGIYMCIRRSRTVRPVLKANPTPPS